MAPPAHTRRAPNERAYRSDPGRTTMTCAASLMLAILAAAAAFAGAAAAPAAPAAAQTPPPPKPQSQQRLNFSFTLPRPRPLSRPLVKVTIDARLGRRSVDGVPRDVVLVAGVGGRAATAAGASPAAGAPPAFQPPIYVTQGDELELTLVNGLPPSWPQAGGGISVHQHGFSMADGAAAWHDGAAEITACKVPPFNSSGSGSSGSGRPQSRVARFVVRERPGTYFWHEHASALRGDGLQGALIVRPPPWAPRAPLATLPGAGFGSDDPSLFPRAAKGGRASASWDAPPERLVFLSDWWHLSQDAMALRFNRPFDPAKQDGNATGRWHWIGLPKSVLINGRGSYGACEDVTTRALGRPMRSGALATADDLLLPDGVAGQLKPAAAFPTCNATGLLTPAAAAAAAAANASAAASPPSPPGLGAPAVIDVPRGRTTLLRVVNAANLVYLTFCVRDHWLRVVAADAVPVAPLDAFECVDVNAGQRLDVLLVANATTAAEAAGGGVFWVSASPQYRKGAPTGYAVLRYVDAGDGDDDADVDGGAGRPPPPLLDRLPPQEQMIQPRDAPSRARSLDALLRIHPLMRAKDALLSDWPPAAALRDPADRRLLALAVQAARAAGNQAPAWDSAEGRRYGPPKLDDGAASSAAAAVVGPAPFSPPREVTRRYVLRTTQPLIEANGFIRWAVNNVASSLAPDCPPLLRQLYESSSAYLAQRRMNTSLTRAELLQELPGGGPYFAGAADPRRSTLGPTDSPGVAVFDGSGDDEVLVRRATPRAGLHVLSLPVGEAVELVFVNERAGAHGGEYGDRDPARNPNAGLVANRTSIEQHPWHVHGYHAFVVGQGRGKWTLADVARYNLEDPALRDTWSLLGPAPGASEGGWTAVRLRSSNTGAWPVHCHVQAHQMLGQAVVLVVGDVSPRGGALAPPPPLSDEARATCSAACNYQFGASPPSVGEAMFGARMAPDSNKGFVVPMMPTTTSAPP